MIGHRKHNARMQIDFYRNQFRRFMRWLLIEVVVMLLFLMTIVYLLIVQPSRTFYANTTDGKMLPLVEDLKKGN